MTSEYSKYLTKDTLYEKKKSAYFEAIAKDTDFKQHRVQKNANINTIIFRPKSIRK